MGYNPKSLENLGKPKTKAGVRKFRLSQFALDFLGRFPNQTQKVEDLIMQAAIKTSYTIRNVQIKDSHYGEEVSVEATSFLEAAAIACEKWGWQTPVDYIGSSNGQYTLLSGSVSANVIGKVYWMR